MNDNVKPNKPNEAPIEDTLYKKREKIYPREVHGTFALLRNLAMVTLLGFYYFTPWFNWGGHQIILFDLPDRKFYLGPIVLWPQDFFFLAILLIISALALFFFTALAGRLWCGYACPQTVWTEIYMWIERKIEGDRKAQMKMDKGPMDARKFRIKFTKQFAWLAFSLWTGFTFVGYFTPIRELAESFITWNLGPWETFWIFFYGFATYGNAGFLREQVCIYMCPYARFQSAMFDKNTLIISYDEKRGDPRGPRKRGVQSAEVGKGDCIDCKLCVQVCPTGIDIRDGLQYQCIGCAACIDVCDEVMDKMGYDKGLVKYTTENELEGKESNMFRPRTLFYGGVLIALTIAVFVGLFTRTPIEVDVIRDRNALFNETGQGWIENIYTLKLVNMAEQPAEYKLSVAGMDQIRFVDDPGTITVDSGAVADLPVRIEVPPSSIKQKSSEIFIKVEATNMEGVEINEPARFLGPVGR